MDLEDFYLLRTGGTTNLSQAHIVLGWMLRLCLVIIFVFYFQKFYEVSLDQEKVEGLFFPQIKRKI